ncbi:MAG: hypothetical protein JSW37_00445 [Anaerolineales bacterium]|nr:MAG: hypothetical protein JSW37_00445 [Anaerolineales bacterium]
MEDETPLSGPIEEAIRGLGMRHTVHRGEAAGAEGIREAIELHCVQRVGHGFRVAAPQCITQLCPTSNV